MPSVLEVNRDTGGMKIVGGNLTVPILGYKITSDVGALDQRQWTTVTGNYDMWMEMRLVGQRRRMDRTYKLDQSYGPQRRELMAAMGARSASVRVIDLGTPWIQNPTEDLEIEILRTDGTIETLSVNFTGNSGQAFEVGDMDFNGVIGPSDWPISGPESARIFPIVAAGAYRMGDLNGDGVNDSIDFGLFKKVYNAANGEAHSPRCSRCSRTIDLCLARIVLRHH